MMTKHFISLSTAFVILKQIIDSPKSLVLYEQETILYSYMEICHIRIIFFK